MRRFLLAVGLMAGTVAAGASENLMEEVGFFSFQAAQGYYLALTVLSGTLIQNHGPANARALARNSASALKRCEDAARLLENRVSGSAQISARELTELYASLKTYAQAILSYAETPNSDTLSRLQKQDTLSADKIERFGQIPLE